MKGLSLFLAACFVVPTLGGAMADSTRNSARGTSTRPPQTTIATTPRATGTVKQRNTTTQKTTAPKVSQRSPQTNTNVKNRSVTTQPRETSVISRSTKKPTTAPKNTTKTQSTTAPRTHRSGLSRSATTTRETVLQRDFGKCKSIFFDCMDEFCANKDTQLKRCACSSRTNEFKSTQKSLDNIEDKLLDFSQRLLKVNMDPSDAAVINVESEGEKAYRETKDKTASRKTLDEIANKLNSDFDSAGKNNLSALSWSLDTQAAFDSVNSLDAVSTSAKSGVALRNAALPICREMAAEVCSEDDISLVENSYNMAIEQDCNTVKNAYKTQTQQAKTKVLESGALLDMTRLNTYQDNNSDDILSCKSKMLEMLSNTNVCGENLVKCLDISGRYINPTTGEAFLSADLVNLSTLIVRPTGSETWAKLPKNSAFVSHLNSKKKYMESATKSCQAIADNVWNEFIEDALAQIKLAQNAKLEEVRQSCTSLMTDCLDAAKTDLAEFDSRALSTFGVMTDKTANALCESVKKSCSAVMQYNFDDETIVANTSTNTDEWTTGVTEIANRETYQKIIDTCREVGRDCIINSCKSITGNFGLCESIHDSINRHSILTRASCWQEVYDCVSDASDSAIMGIRNILPIYGTSPLALYKNMYAKAVRNYNSANAPYNSNTEQYNENSASYWDIYDICRSDNGAPCGIGTIDQEDPNDAKCYKCRIAEQIWGNCRLLPDNMANNPILMPDDSATTTLLSWFAKNTHTNDNDNSCATSMCPAGSIDISINNSIECEEPKNVLQCIGANYLCKGNSTTNGNNGPTISGGGSKLIFNQIFGNSGVNNCCTTDTYDKFNGCCMNGGVTSNIYAAYSDLLTPSYVNSNHHTHYFVAPSPSDPENHSTYSTDKLCTPSNSIGTMYLLTTYYTTTYDNNNNPIYTYRYIFCAGSLSGTNGENAMFTCDGKYILLDVVYRSTPNNANKHLYHRYGTVECADTEPNENGCQNLQYKYDMNYFYPYGIYTNTQGLKVQGDADDQDNLNDTYCNALSSTNNTCTINTSGEWTCGSNTPVNWDNVQNANNNEWLIKF